MEGKKLKFPDLLHEEVRIITEGLSFKLLATGKYLSLSKGGKMSFKRSALIILFSLAMASVLSAQATRQTGVIRGLITDNTGAPIPGVTITAESPALMGSATSITDTAGLYRLINLPPGIYTITASLTGFKTIKQPGIIVQAGQTYTGQSTD